MNIISWLLFAVFWLALAILAGILRPGMDWFAFLCGFLCSFGVWRASVEAWKGCQ